MIDSALIAHVLNRAPDLDGFFGLHPSLANLPGWYSSGNLVVGHLSPPDPSGLFPGHDVDATTRKGLFISKP